MHGGMSLQSTPEKCSVTTGGAVAAVEFISAEFVWGHHCHGGNWGAVDPEVPENPGGRVCGAGEVVEFRVAAGAFACDVKADRRAELCIHGDRLT